MNLLEDILNNSGLLLEAFMTIDKIYDKFFSDIPRDRFNSLIKTDPTYKGGDKKGKYLDWIMKHAKDEKIRNIKIALFSFNKNIEIFSEKELEKHYYNTDISSYKNLEELEKKNLIIRRFSESRVKSIESKTISKQNIKIVYEDSRFRVITPMSHGASLMVYSRLFKEAKLPKETSRWCTAEKNSPLHFNRHTIDYNLVIIEDKTKTGSEHAYQYSRYNSEFRNLANDIPKGLSFIKLLENNFDKYTIDLIEKSIGSKKGKKKDKEVLDKYTLKSSMEEAFKVDYKIPVTKKLIKLRKDSNITKPNGYLIDGYKFENIPISGFTAGTKFINCEFNNTNSTSLKVNGRLKDCKFLNGIFSGTFEGGEFINGVFNEGSIRDAKIYKGIINRNVRIIDIEIYDFKTNKYVKTDEAPSEYKNSYQNFEMGYYANLDSMKTQLGIEFPNMKKIEPNRRVSIRFKNQGNYAYSSNRISSAEIKNAVIGEIKGNAYNFKFINCEINNVKKGIDRCTIINSKVKNITTTDTSIEDSTIDKSIILSSETINCEVSNSTFNACNLRDGKIKDSTINNCILTRDIITTDCNIEGSQLFAMYYKKTGKTELKYKDNIILKNKTEENPIDYKQSYQNTSGKIKNIKESIINLI